MAIFNSFLYVYQMVTWFNRSPRGRVPGGLMGLNGGTSDMTHSNWTWQGSSLDGKQMHQMLKCLRRAFGSKKYSAYVYIYIIYILYIYYIYYIYNDIYIYICIHLSVHANFDDLNPYLSMKCWAQAAQAQQKKETNRISEKDFRWK